jgi:hypothetical protein
MIVIPARHRVFDALVMRGGRNDRYYTGISLTQHDRQIDHVGNDRQQEVYGLPVDSGGDGGGYQRWSALKVAGSFSSNDV